MNSEDLKSKKFIVFYLLNLNNIDRYIIALTNFTMLNS